MNDGKGGGNVTVVWLFIDFLGFHSKQRRVFSNFSTKIIDFKEIILFKYILKAKIPKKSGLKKQFWFHQEKKYFFFVILTAEMSNCGFALLRFDSMCFICSVCFISFHVFYCFIRIVWFCISFLSSFHLFRLKVEY